MPSNDENLSKEIQGLKKQIEDLTILLRSHIESETDLLVAWNGFNWTKKVGIQIITFLGTIVAVTYGLIQIIKIIK